MGIANIKRARHHNPGQSGVSLVLMPELCKFGLITRVVYVWSYYRVVPVYVYTRVVPIYVWSYDQSGVSLVLILEWCKFSLTTREV